MDWVVAGGVAFALWIAFRQLQKTQAENNAEKTVGDPRQTWRKGTGQRAQAATDTVLIKSIEPNPAKADTIVVTYASGNKEELTRSQFDKRMKSFVFANPLQNKKTC